MALTPLTLPTPTSSSTTVVDSGAGRRGSLAAIALVMAVVAVIAAVAFSGGGDDAGVPPDSFPEPSTDEAFEEQPLRRPDLAVPDGSTAVDGTTQAMLDELRLVIGESRLAYISDDDAVVLDARPDGEATLTLPMSPGRQPNVFLELSSVALLSNDELTIGLSDGPDGNGGGLQAFELSNQGPLIRGQSIVTLVSGAREVTVGTSLGFSQRLTIPPVASTLTVPGLGLLVVPTTGGTFLARPGEFVQYSDDPVLAATPTHRVELRCDDGLDCGAWFVSDDDNTLLPSAFAGPGTITISPDGRTLLLVNSGDDRLLDTKTGQVSRIRNDAKGPIVWTEDSTAAAWLVPDSLAPQVDVFRVEQRDITRFDFALLGLPSASSPYLLLF